MSKITDIVLDEVEELVTGDGTAQLYCEYASVVGRDNAVLFIVNG